MRLKFFMTWLLLVGLMALSLNSLARAAERDLLREKAQVEALPTLVVTAKYPGANAKQLADAVAAPLEGQIKGVENMQSMSSQCTVDGGYTLTILFKPKTDLKIAQVLVQNRVALALPLLPEAVRLQGVDTKTK